jgi:polar amino acid transport system substrate-binding protein
MGGYVVNRIIKIFLVLTLLFSISTIAIAQDGDTLADIVKQGVVKVGFCVDTPPMKFRDQNQEPAGICADFAEALARDLGVKLEYVFSDWGGLIPTLLSKRSDVIISNMSTTLERAKAVNFTNPWLVTGTHISVRSDSEWESWQEMNQEGVEIGCVLGAVTERNIREFLPDATPATYNSIVEQKLALEQGRIDGISGDRILMEREVARSDGKLRMFPDALKSDPLGFTLRPDDFHLLTWMNLWLDSMRDSGEYDELVNYWLLTDKWQKDYPGY